MKLFKSALALVCMLALQQLQAQEDLRSSRLEIVDSTASKYQAFDFNLKVKTMHLWKGLRVISITRVIFLTQIFLITTAVQPLIL